MLINLVRIAVGMLLILIILVFILLMVYAAATLCDFIREEMKKGKKHEG